MSAHSTWTAALKTVEEVVSANLKLAYVPTSEGAYELNARTLRLLGKLPAEGCEETIPVHRSAKRLLE
jgi:hypothetical protein